MASRAAAGYSRISVTSPFRRKITKVIAYALASLVALVGVVVVGAVLLVQGERLAKIVNGVLPEQRGKMHFGAILLETAPAFRLGG